VERALRLARQLGDQELANAVLEEIERRVIQLDGADPLYMTARLMELLHEFRKGDPDQMKQDSPEGSTISRGGGGLP
jgi:hypothetical protein